MIFDIEAGGMRWSAFFSSNTVPVSASMINAARAWVSIGPTTSTGAAGALPGLVCAAGLFLAGAARAGDGSGTATSAETTSAAAAAIEKNQRKFIALSTSGCTTGPRPTQSSTTRAPG